MKDKEMIEEMAKDLKTCLPNNWYWQKTVDTDTYLVAKHFHNQGYRKIPEDSVVLSREEFDEDYVTKQDRDYWKYKAEMYKDRLKQARKEKNDYKQRFESSEKRYEQLVQSSCEALEKKGKETAEKILNEQYQECKVAEKEVLIARGGNKNDDYYKGFSLGMVNTKMHIQELATQFGVDLKG